MEDADEKLREMLNRIEELLSLASEGLLKAKRYGDEKAQIEDELIALGKSFDERDRLRIEKVVPKMRSVYKSDVFLQPDAINGISDLRSLLFQLLAKRAPAVPASAVTSSDNLPRLEKVIPSGRPYDGVKYLRSIFAQARKSIFIRDNYLRPAVLDVLSEYILGNETLSVRLLVTHDKRTPALRASYIAFSGQYGTQLKVRILPAEMKDHPRYILIDDARLFTPDHSLDQWGINTVNVHEHESDSDIQAVISRLGQEWITASPL